MTVENVKVFYFSPTGGTKNVAMALAKAWSEVEEIDLSEYGRDFSDIEINENEVVIFAVPSFAGRAPAVSIERMMQIKGNGAKTIIVAAYGARDYDDVLLEMKNTCIENKFQVIAGVAAVTEHSLAKMIATGRPNEKDKNELLAFGQKVKKSIEEGKSFEEIKVKGQVPYKKVSRNPIKPKANKDCIACGLCAKNCPVQAISVNKIRSVDTRLCINCMRCVANCPTNARSMGAVITRSMETGLQKICKSDKENEYIIE